MNKKISIQLALAFTLLLSGIFITVETYHHAPLANEVRVTVFDVGQGDSILAEMPDGENVLIDGGPDSSVIGKLEQTLGSFNHDISIVILTHPHLDHLAGLLEVLKRYHVGKILLSGAPHSTNEYIDFLKLIDQKNIPAEIALQGKTYQFGEATLSILYPDKDFTNLPIPHDDIAKGGGLNDTSIVALLAFKDKKMLLTGDASSMVEAKLLAKLPTVDVLKVGHHGSKYSSGPDFLKKIQPRYAIISVGRINKYGHPHYRTLKNLKDIGAQVFRTDLNGDVEVRMSASGVTVVPSRS